MEVESYAPPVQLAEENLGYEEDIGHEYAEEGMGEKRGGRDRARRVGRWNREEPARKARSRSRERDYWDEYDDYEEYDEREVRDRRDRYRERERKDRYRDCDDRGRSDRERGRDRRERDRGRERRRRSSDRYDRDRDQYRQRDYDYEDGDYYRSERGGSDMPTNLVMMRGLPYSADEEDISTELQQKGLTYKDIKIIKDKHGDSRGFGFVEFQDVKVAERWLYLTQSTLVLKDRTVRLEYGKPRPPEQDWACGKCGTLNYASRRRTSCFSCGAAKEEAAEDPYYDDYYHDQYYDDDSLSSSGGMGGSYKDRDAPASAPPCNILIMRGLDVNTSEETVRNHVIQVAGIPIYDVRLIKDKVTGMSRGFCFIELGSTEDATKLLEAIQNMDPPYTIENKKVLVGYARNTLHPPPSKPKSRSELKSSRPRNATHAGNTQIANTAIAQAQAAQAQGFYNQQQPVQSQQFAQGTPASQQSTGTSTTGSQHAGQAYDQQYSDQAKSSQNAQQYQQYQQYYQQQAQNQQTSPAQSQQGQLFHQMYDISSFSYDQTTGYYYDPNSGLYYDANTGYHYNGSTGQFLYWDATHQQYYIVNQDGSLSAATAGTGTADNQGGEGIDGNKDKGKVTHKPSGPSARKIAKDMERWAKKMNEATAIKQNAVKQAMIELKAQEAREEALRKQMEDEGVFKKPQLPNTGAPTVKKVKSLFTPDEDGESPLLGGTQKPKKQSLVAEYGGDDSDEESDLDSKFIDVNKLACLLCQRQFGNKETLIKHQQMSDLHKQNLEKYKKKLLS